MPSFEPARPEFEPQRYWRGPVWLIVNWMLIDGLRRNGRTDLAARIRHDCLALVERTGFAEYFNPLAILQYIAVRIGRLRLQSE